MYAKAHEHFVSNEKWRSAVLVWFHICRTDIVEFCGKIFIFERSGLHGTMKIIYVIVT